MPTDVAWGEAVIEDRWVEREKQRWYRTLDGSFPSVTTILNVCGLGKRALIDWGAKAERAGFLGTLEMPGGVVGAVSTRSPHLRGPELATAVLHAAGEARKHQKLLDEAGNLGSEAHALIQAATLRLLNLDAGAPLEPRPEALRAFALWREWFTASGITPVRAEQAVWDCDNDFAGTIDLIGIRNGKYGVIDYKTSKGIYESHHMQVAAYCVAGRNWVPIEWAEIVRLPKSVTDKPFEVVPMGQLYGGRVALEENLFKSFQGCKTIWDTFQRPA